jgi:histidinol dehydrogenase
MHLIKYPRRQDWERLFISGEHRVSSDLGIYADETANPSEIVEVIFQAVQNQHRVVFVSSHSLLIEALLDEIDKGLINIAEKQTHIISLNASIFLLMRNEQVSIELLKVIRPKKVFIFCADRDRLVNQLGFNPVANANNLDNIG